MKSKSILRFANKQNQLKIRKMALVIYIMQEKVKDALFYCCIS